MGNDPQNMMLKLVKKGSVTGTHKFISQCKEGRVWGEAKGTGLNCYKVQPDVGQIIRSGEFATKSPVSQDAITCITASKKGDKGFIGLHSGRIAPYSPSTTTDMSFAAHSSRVTAIVLIEKASKTIVWSSSADGFIKIWEGSKATSKATGHRGEVTGVIHVPFASGGGIMWSFGIDKTIRVWDKAASSAAGSGSNRRAAILKCTDAVTSLVADESQGVVWSCDKNCIRAWSADTRNCIWSSTRGGTSLTICGDYVAVIADHTHIALWPLQLPSDLEEDMEYPPLTTLALTDKMHASRMIAPSPTSLLVVSDKAITLCLLQSLSVDPGREILVEKSTDESVGAIFHADDSLLLERVEPGSAAERCGAARFLGWQLVQVNHTPVSTVADVRVNVRKQARFILTFQVIDSERSTAAPEERHSPLIRRASSKRVKSNSISKAPSVASNTSSNYSAAAARASAPPPAAIPATATNIPEIGQLKHQNGHFGETRRSSPSANSHPASPVGTKKTPFSKAPVKKVIKKAPTKVAAAEVPAYYKELADVARDIVGNHTVDDELPNALRRTVHDLQTRSAEVTVDNDRQLADLRMQIEERNEKIRELESDGVDRLKIDLEDTFKKILDPSINEVLTKMQSYQGKDSETHSPEHSPPPMMPAPTTPPSLTLENLMTRCSDAVNALHTVQNLNLDWEYRCHGSAEEQAESLLHGLKMLHTGLCVSKDTQGKEVMQQAVLLSAQTILSERGDRSFEQVQTSARSLSHQPHSTRRLSSEHTTPAQATPVPLPRRSVMHEERFIAPPELSEVDKNSPTPSPLTRNLVPLSPQEDAHYARLFELRGHLQNWLQQKPSQLHERTLHIERDASVRGAAAVQSGEDEFEDYLTGERKEYEDMMLEVEEGLADGHASGAGSIEPLRRMWQKLEETEDNLKDLLDKLQRDFSDAQAIAASIHQKLAEFRTFIDEADAALRTAKQEFQSNENNDAQLCQFAVQCVALHLWCKSRVFEAILEGQLDGQLQYVTDTSERARLENESTSVERSWEVLEEMISAVTGAAPPSEIDGHIEFVWVLLELCGVSLSQNITPDVAAGTLDKIMTTVLPQHQQMIIRLNDVDVDDDTLPALETLCDEVGRVHTTVFQPVLVQNGKIASQTGGLSQLIVKGLQRDCRLRSHHIPRHQLDPAQLAHSMKKVVQAELSPNAVGLTPNVIEELLNLSLTKGGTVVILNTLGQLSAFHILKANQPNNMTTDETPRSSLSSLVSFFKNRLGAGQ